MHRVSCMVQLAVNHTSNDFIVTTVSMKLAASGPIDH